MVSGRTGRVGEFKQIVLMQVFFSRELESLELLGHWPWEWYGGILLQEICLLIHELEAPTALPLCTF